MPVLGFSPIHSSRGVREPELAGMISDEGCLCLALGPQSVIDGSNGDRGGRPFMSSQRRARCINAMLSGPPETARTADGNGSRQENARNNDASLMMLGTVLNHVWRTYRILQC